MSSIPECTCGVAHKIHELEQNQRLIKFLMGLNNEYTATRGSILMMKPLPTVAQAYTLLIQDEKQCELQSSSIFISESASMIAKNGSNFSKGNYDNKKNLVGTHCKKSGHSVNKCFRLISFPKEFKSTKGQTVVANANKVDPNFSMNNTAGSNDSSQINLINNQYQQLSGQFQQLMSMMNAVKNGGNSIDKNGVTDSQDIGNSSSTNFAGNTHSTYKTPVNCHFLTTSTSTCITDSSASNHMCHDKCFLFHIRKLDRPHSITLPNGHKTYAFEDGNTFITDNVVLTNVLYVPIFQYNLLSIGRLCKMFKSSVVFSEQYCFLLQGPSMKRPLVLGRYQSGLYLFKSRSQRNNCTTLSVASNSKHSNSYMFFVQSLCNVVSSDDVVSLWHKRLGHLPLYKLKTLSFLISNLCNAEFVCDVCPKARQHKLPFKQSSIHTSSLFDLIHVDTWGPYNTKTYNGQSYFLTLVDDFTRST